MGRWRKKPLEIEAVQFTGGNWPEIARFLGKDEEQVEMVEPDPPDNPYLLITTPEGVMRADLSCWVIRGIKGELYGCQDSIFRDTYEAVD